MKIYILLLSLFFPAENIFSADLSSVYVGLDTYDADGALSMVANAHFVIVDPLGRMTGHNPSTNEDTNEIPNSGYSIESLGELKEGGDSANENDILPGPEKISFEMGPVQVSGIYNVRIFGVRETRYSLKIRMNDRDHKLASLKYEGYLSSVAINTLNIAIDPTPGAPAPVITKIVTFDALRQDLTVAQSLKQIGDDKFVASLNRVVNLAGRLADKCNKHDKHRKSCAPAVAVLKLFVMRLETANRRCDSKNPGGCDEDRDWDDFGKEHRKDHDYDDFFREWDRDDWHKHKKTCKRFVTDEALKIIKEDAQWLIKSLGGEIDKKHGDKHGHEEKGR